MIKKIFKKNFKKGFTLIETMVAITVLMTAIVGPMEIASKALFSSYYARDQITAYYLAQEGIEIVRAKRDSYVLANPTNYVANVSQISKGQVLAKPFLENIF